MALRIRFVGVFVVLSAACGTGSDSGPVLRSEVRDSAGVTIVENARPATGSQLGWRVGEAPAVSIGTQEGEEAEMLYIVDDATKLADGRIVIANAGTSELRVFSAVGEHLSTWGGQGEGPGEFSAYSPEAASWWPGDSVAGSNSWRRRIEVFDSQGSHGRSVTMPDGYHAFLGVMPDGTILVKPSTVLGGGIFGAGDPLVRRPANFGLLMPGGELRVSLGDQPGEEWFSSQTAPMARPHLSAGPRYPPSGEVIRSWPPPTATNFGPTRATVPWRRSSVATTTSGVRRRPNWTPGSRKATPTCRKNDERGCSLRWKRCRSSSSSPRSEALQSDPLGCLWVREYELPGENHNRWTVFDAEGRVQGFRRDATRSGGLRDRRRLRSWQGDGRTERRTRATLASRPYSQVNAPPSSSVSLPENHTRSKGSRAPCSPTERSWSWP